MDPKEIVQILDIEVCPPLNDPKEEEVVQKLYHSLVGPVTSILQLEEHPSEQTRFEETAIFHKQIGTTLITNLFPQYGDSIGDIGTRLSKLIFDELKTRGFGNKAIVVFVAELLNAFGAASTVVDNHQYASDDEDDYVLSDEESEDGEEENAGEGNNTEGKGHTEETDVEMATV